jgi:hopene-associated glycosyltransferase HpnB
MIVTLVAVASLLVWLYLVAFHGGFWRLAQHDGNFAPPGAPAPDGIQVTAIVPARNEADVIGTSLGSLFGQAFSGALDVVLVDDESDDGTADAARAAASAHGAAERLTVIASGGPAPGWTGKLAAMQRGFAHVRSRARQPDFILFCDADIAFDPDCLERFATGARARNTTLASLMVKLRCESPAERWLVPAFVFFFQMLYPFARVNDPKGAVAGAAGGVMLVRTEALEKAGGLFTIKNALIDDCALGALMKTQGPIWLGLTHSAHSLRPYPHFVDIERMVTRSAYAQLGYSPLRLFGAVAGMSLVYLAPPLIGFFGPQSAAEPALFAYALMALSYMPSLRFYGLSSLRGFALPLVAACYTWFTVESALQHSRGRGGAWKGRYQAPSGNRES